MTSGINRKLAAVNSTSASVFLKKKNRTPSCRPLATMQMRNRNVDQVKTSVVLLLLGLSHSLFGQTVLSSYYLVVTDSTFKSIYSDSGQVFVYVGPIQFESHDLISLKPTSAHAGRYVVAYPSGKPAFMAAVKDEALQDVIQWHLSGVIRFRGKYFNGMPYGTHIWYYGNGKPSSIRAYSDLGMQLNYISFDENGCF